MAQEIEGTNNNKWEGWINGGDRENEEKLDIIDSGKKLLFSGFGQRTEVV